MTDLLDVNVWVAIAANEHPHHERALAYWYEESNPRLLFCNITMMGFVRVITHPHLFGGKPLSVPEAWAAYRSWRSDPTVGFEHEPPRCQIQLDRFVAEERVKPRTWTDAYLAAFAVAGSHRLVTFDGDMAKFPDLDLLLLKSSA